MSDQVFSLLTGPEDTTVARYIQGRFAEDLLTISNQTYTSENKSQFFQMSNVTNALNDISMVDEVQGDGWFGLADGHYAEDLIS